MAGGGKVGSGDDTGSTGVFGAPVQAARVTASTNCVGFTVVQRARMS